MYSTDVFKDFLSRYRFDSFSNYVDEFIEYEAIDHLDNYRGGNCLDLATGLAAAIGGEIIGIYKPNYPFHIHYANIVDNHWFDSSVGYYFDIKSGEEFYIGKNHYKVLFSKPLKEDLTSIELLKNNSELRTWQYRSINGNTEVESDITRKVQKRLTLRNLTSITPALMYYPVENRFLWDNVELSYEQVISQVKGITYALRLDLDLSLYLKRFFEVYLDIPAEYWLYYYEN